MSLTSDEVALVYFYLWILYNLVNHIIYFSMGVELKTVWMSFGCKVGRVEQNRMGPGTGSGVQRCVIVWCHWRLLEANWCFSDLCATPELSHRTCCRAYAVLRFIMRLLNNWFLIIRVNILNVQFPVGGADSAVEVFPELLKWTEINSGWATYLPDTSERRTHGADWVSPAHSTKTKQNNKRRRWRCKWTYIFKTCVHNMDVFQTF